MAVKALSSGKKYRSCVWVSRSIVPNNLLQIRRRPPTEIKNELYRKYQDRVLMDFYFDGLGVKTRDCFYPSLLLIT